jgi:hypothetical protein
MPKPRGFIFYRGPSTIDGSPIVGIAVLRSTNVKTGDMVQTYILRSDVAPVDAAKTGQDESICGDCPLRPTDTGVCYVTLFHGPRATYDGYTRGIYPDLSDRIPEIRSLIDGRMVRLGAYGDPAAIPAVYWGNLLKHGMARGWTGYTHQWHKPQFEWLKGYCQASCDSLSDAMIAQAEGWGTFTLLPVGANDRNLRVGGRKQIACPYPKTGLQCHDCGLCNGRSRRNITVHAHGSGASKLQEVTR